MAVKQTKRGAAATTAALATLATTAAAGNSCYALSAKAVLREAAEANRERRAEEMRRAKEAERLAAGAAALRASKWVSNAQPRSSSNSMNSRSPKV